MTYGADFLPVSHLIEAFVPQLRVAAKTLAIHSNPIGDNRFDFPRRRHVEGRGVLEPQGIDGEA